MQDRVKKTNFLIKNQITMKGLLVVFLASVITANVHSQNYLISFEGSGETTIVDSVVVKNLTQGTSLTVDGNDQLLLVDNLTGIDHIRENKDNKLRIYPNPAKEYCTVEFYVPIAGVISTELYDISGKIVLLKSKYSEKGSHFLQISGLGLGIYNINIQSTEFKYTGKIVSQNNTKGSAQINFFENADNFLIETQIKSKMAQVEMQYNLDDRLMLSGYSNIYSTVVMDVPQESKTISFNFIACTDADENNYKVVTIGTQTWMAENLKTTHYSGGDEIPDGTGAGDILGENNPNYWFAYDDVVDNVSTYGRLYTWYTVTDNRNVCPDNWHIPSDTEWTILTDYLGEMIIAGGKLKETGTVRWLSPNTEATNESGFSALPAGGRNYSGIFDDMGSDGLWWSSTEESTTNAWYRYTFYNGGNVAKSNGTKEVGFSVRCVKD